MTAQHEQQPSEAIFRTSEGPHSGACVCNKLTAALDRHTEAHWHLHQIDNHYHQADPFRYSLNGFLRALKEVPQILQMKLQQEKGFKKWFRPRLEALRDDPLFGAFSKHRDYLVHQGMLIPRSFAHVGTTRDGAWFKIGIPFATNASEDSDRIIARFIEACRENEVLYGLAIGHGDDSQLPCVGRGWRLSSFPEDELRTLTLRAWVLVGKMLNETLEWLGHDPLPSELPPCLAEHSKSTVRIKVYPKELFDAVVPPASHHEAPARAEPTAARDAPKPQDLAPTPDSGSGSAI